MLSTRNCGWYDKCILRIRYVSRRINEYALDFLSLQISFISQDLILILSTDNFIFLALYTYLYYHTDSIL